MYRIALEREDEVADVSLDQVLGDKEEIDVNEIFSLANELDLDDEDY